MSEHLIAEHKLTNIVQTGLLLGGMALLLALLGSVVLGPGGVVWAVLIGIFVLTLTPQISPRVLLRLYRARQIDPHGAPDLYRLILQLTERAQLPVVPRLYYVPSRMLNAFAVGTRSDSAIAVTDGLLRNLSIRELTGVLAHEISHVRHNDMWVMGLADTVSRLTSALSLVGQVLLLISIPLVLFGIVQVSWLALGLLIVAPTLSAFLQMGLSRTREYDADLGAAELTGDPAGLASALQKLDRLQGGWLERILFPGRRLPDPSMLRTHPPVEERIRRLMSLAPRQTLSPPVAENLWRGVFPMDSYPAVARGPRRYWHGLWF